MAVGTVGGVTKLHPTAQAALKLLGKPSARELAEIVCVHHLECHRVVELQAKTLWHKLHALDALRRPERFEEFLLACQADAQGRLGWENKPYPQVDYFRQARAVAAAIIGLIIFIPYF